MGERRPFQKKKKERQVKYIPIIHIKFFKYRDKILQKYNSAEFINTMIHEDNSFKPFMDKVKCNLDVTMNYVNPGDYVHDIDINSRTVTGIYCAQYHRLPFQNIPKVMIKYLASVVVIKLKYFPFKKGLSPYCIPQTILDQQPLDHKKHFTIPFGEFSQAKNDNNPKTSNASRTIYGIYLQLLDKIQGIHGIFQIHNHIVIKRQKMIKITITKAMIKQIEKIAACDKIT